MTAVADPTDGRLFLGIAEVMAATGLSRPTIERKMAAGELPSVRVGRRRLVLVEGLRAWADRLVAEQCAVAARG